MLDLHWYARNIGDSKGGLWDIHVGGWDRLMRAKFILFVDKVPRAPGKSAVWPDMRIPSVKIYSLNRGFYQLTMIFELTPRRFPNSQNIFHDIGIVMMQF